MTETKPEGLTDTESWAWDASAPGSFFRRAAAQKYGRCRKPGEGVEKSRLSATLPGRVGLECVFYEYLARVTVGLEVYVAVVVKDGEFRPSGYYEHFPRGELQRYQLSRGLLGGENSYGRGRELAVTFACYSPEGSGTAEGATTAVSAALKRLEGVVTWPAGKRSWFGMRHGREWVKAAVKRGPPYRPPAGSLPPRSGPPEPKVESAPGLSFGEALDAQVDALLRSWGHPDVADERRREKQHKTREALMKEGGT